MQNTMQKRVQSGPSCFYYFSLVACLLGLGGLGCGSSRGLAPGELAGQNPGSTVGSVEDQQREAGKGGASSDEASENPTGAQTPSEPRPKQCDLERRELRFPLVSLKADDLKTAVLPFLRNRFEAVALDQGSDFFAPSQKAFNDLAQVVFRADLSGFTFLRDKEIVEEARLIWPKMRKFGEANEGILCLIEEKICSGRWNSTLWNGLDFQFWGGSAPSFSAWFSDAVFAKAAWLRIGRVGRTGLYESGALEVDLLQLMQREAAAFGLTELLNRAFVDEGKLTFALASQFFLEPAGAALQVKVKVCRVH